MGMCGLGSCASRFVSGRFAIADRMWSVPPRGGRLTGVSSLCLGWWVHRNSPGELGFNKGI